LQRQKKLIAVPAGSADAVNRVGPLLEATCQKICRAGENPQNSNILKLSGNFMIMAFIQAMAEAFALAESHGIDREVAYELLAAPNGVFNSLPVLSGYGRMIATQTYTPVGFSAENGMKDVNLVCAAADAGGVDMPIAKEVQKRMAELIASDPDGGKETDWATFASLTKVKKQK